MSSLKIVGQKAPAKFNLIEDAGFQGKAAIVTLGCAKNQVDSEVMLGVLRSKGYELVNAVEDADVAIVNTCSFLESAVQEGIDCILDISDLKNTGKLRKLIVAGCMVSRYGSQLKETLPEVDAFVSLDDILKVGEVAGGNDSSLLDGGRPYFLYDDTMPRQLASKSHMAYVKISEGCDRPCAFCIIPKIRGKMRSRELTSVVSEVNQLGLAGVKEVNLVAQDLTDYGKEFENIDITLLLQKLNQSKAVDWIRLLYAYPLGINERLLKTILDSERICNYIDLPLQHASERILKSMYRPVGKYSAKRIVEFIKTTAPEIALRTTFIVGLPGETEADVEDLENLISQGYFTNVGIFTYSPEVGTPAAEMDAQVPQELKNERRERLMLAQQKVVQNFNQQLVGKELTVLVEGQHDETELLLAGRTEFQAPEVDGIVILNDSEVENPESLIGKFAAVEITEFSGYDLIGKIKQHV